MGATRWGVAIWGVDVWYGIENPKFEIEKEHSNREFVKSNIGEFEIEQNRKIEFAYQERK